MVLTSFTVKVALLAEGVDRNILKCPCKAVPIVALLAEGVDRNKNLRMRRRMM